MKLISLEFCVLQLSTKYNKTLELCKFTSKSYQETMDKLHEQDIKYDMIHNMLKVQAEKIIREKISMKTCTTVLKITKTTTTRKKEGHTTKVNALNAIVGDISFLFSFRIVLFQFCTLVIIFLIRISRIRILCIIIRFSCVIF